MSDLTKLWAWFRIDDRQPDIAVSQLVELQRHVPLLYSLLVVNAVAVAFTHYALAPDFLTLTVPSVLVIASLVRLVIWLRRRGMPIEPAVAIETLRRTVRLAVLISIAYIVWSLNLNGYGGPYEQGHVAIFIAVTVIGCIFCLMHLPQAAIAVTLVVNIPYLAYCFYLNNTVFMAIALNIMLVTAVMIQVLLNSFNAFTKLIRSQADLANKQMETERLAEENSRLAHMDVLTGLPNRRYFFTRLNALIDRASQSDTVFTVAAIDLDRFKPVNDTYGHVLGDRLLAQVGDRLAACVGEDTIVARLGCDEFGFLFMADGETARMLGQKLSDRLSEPYDLEGVIITIGCSCGLAAFPEAGNTANTLFDRSDYALYISKTARQGVATLYSAEHESKVRSERAIEAALRSADLDTEFDLAFQPIFAARRNDVVSVEALARWVSPSLGKVRPDVFIAIAERTGLMHGLTLVLFRKALSYLEQLPSSIKLSFNLSAQDVTSPQTMTALVAIIRSTGADPRRLIFELTETAVMRNFDIAVDSITLLRAMGSQVALDDFGTGQSSLGYLHRLTIDKVKTDRSFIAGLHQASGRKIMASIIGLCHNLDLQCVVEGVEEETQFEILGSLGCSIYQGYYFSAPLPMVELLDWIDERRYRALSASAFT